MKLNYSLSLYIKLNSKGIKDLDVKCIYSLNLIGKKVGNVLEFIGTGKDFPNRTPVAHECSNN